MIIVATICCVVGAIWRALSRQPSQPSKDARLSVQANRINAPYRLTVPPAVTSSTDARRAA